MRVKNPSSSWITKELPHLAIVDAELWNRVQARKTAMSSIYLRGRRGRLNGKPEVGGTSEHLLAGFCVCAECGAKLVVTSASSDRAKVRYLICWRRRSGGKAACKNKRHVPLAPLTKAIVDHLIDKVLTPDAVAKAQAEIAADAKGSPDELAARRAELVGEVKKLEARVERLVDSIADGGGDSKALAARLAKEEAQVEAAKRRLRQHDETRAAVAQWTEEGREDQVDALLGDVKGALQGAPVVARQILGSYS